jgi:uncharacterized membrane protein YdjX (TVP38/TMEM64 family)
MARGTIRAWVKPVVLVVVIVSLVLLSRWLGLGKRLAELQDWIKSIGLWGPVVFVIIYAGTTVAAIPGSAMSIIAGSMFGSIIGVISVSIGSTLGASLAFLAARYFARDAIVQWLGKKEKFRKLDEITRLVPLFPFTLLNYGFGLTRVPFKIYVFWSWLCMLPGTVMYVVGSDAVTKAITLGEIPWLLVGIFVFVIILIIFLVRHAKSMLREENNQGEVRK